MLKYFNYDIVFQEIPEEVTLAVNFSLCPNKCPNCHSPWLWEDKGEEFNQNIMDYLFNLYKDNFTCFAFMGGDNCPEQINLFAGYIKHRYPAVKTAWYSGKDELDKNIDTKNFDYIKLGRYEQSLGGLKEKTTNQRLWKFFPDGKKEDITYKLQRK